MQEEEVIPHTRNMDSGTVLNGPPPTHLPWLASQIVFDAYDTWHAVVAAQASPPPV